MLAQESSKNSFINISENINHLDNSTCGVIENKYYQHECLKSKLEYALHESRKNLTVKQTFLGPQKRLITLIERQCKINMHLPCPGCERPIRLLIKKNKKACGLHIIINKPKHTHTHIHTHTHTNGPSRRQRK